MFIVMEGSYGSGIGTQFIIIKEMLERAGHSIATYVFPQYSEQSSYFVREYLNGNYGSGDELGAKTPSLFYALDRFQASHSMRRDIDAGKIILCNRFVGSNLAHQGQKINDHTERQAYYNWLIDLEFNILNIPRPDLNIVLYVPAEIAQTMVDQKAARNYTDKKRDIHEADLNHLKRSVATYQELCNEFPNEFTLVDCMKDGELLTIPQVTDAILSKIKPLLPSIKQTA
jgi:dTMP kinase